MVKLGDLMVINGDSMVINADLMVIIGNILGISWEISINGCPNPSAFICGT